MNTWGTILPDGRNSPYNGPVVEENEAPLRKQEQAGETAAERPRGAEGRMMLERQTWPGEVRPCGP